MSMDTSLTEKAWLLSIDGTFIGVHKHPNPKHEFQDIIELINEYGSEKAKAYVKEYLESSSAEAKKEIIDYYYTNWCKVRAWEIFNEEVTFRICPDRHKWYSAIVAFLLSHPQFRNSNITVESDSLYSTKTTYWDRISYSEAINDANAAILAPMLGKE